jgi:hypothetical protein
MAQKARMKIFERMKNGKRRHILTVLGIGRTKKAAKANVRRNARTALKRAFTEKGPGKHRTRKTSKKSRRRQ